MAARKRTTNAPPTGRIEPIHPRDYADFLAGIKRQIRQRQYRALRAVNHELVALYWELGEAISRKQEEQGWGKSVVETLARDLQAEFPGRNGFSARNLWNMLDFYRCYAANAKLQPLVAEISWAKNLVIFSRCKDDLTREFYLRATARFGWKAKIHPSASSSVAARTRPSSNTPCAPPCVRWVWPPTPWCRNCPKTTGPTCPVRNRSLNG